MKTKRAALLCRVSTSNSQQSTDRQVEDLLEYAQKNGFTVDKDDIYEDAISGFSKHETRPALSRLLSNIKNNKKQYSMVIAWEVSRLARRPEIGQKILIELTEAGIPVYIYKSNMCTIQPNGERNEMFFMMFSMLLEYAATEVSYLKSRVKSGMKNKVKTQNHAGGGVFQAFGYTKGENKELVILEEEAVWVHKIFALAARGVGNNTIAHMLNQHGVPTKSQKVLSKGTYVWKGPNSSTTVKHTKNIKWEGGVIDGIIHNTVYIGKRRWKGETYPCPVMITEELFNKVQAVKKNKYDKRLKETRYVFLLANGIGVCSRCGASLMGVAKDRFYRCFSTRDNTKNCKCYAISLEALESTLWDVIRHSHQLFKHVESSGGKLKEVQAKTEVLQHDLTFTETELTQLEKEMERVKTMYKKGMLTESELEADYERINKAVSSKQSLTQRLRKQLQSLQDHTTMLTNRDTNISIIKKIEMDRFQVAEVVSNVVERVAVQSVRMESNVYEYVVAIWIVGMNQPIHLLLTTKQSSQHNKSFMLPEWVEESGQNRFKYASGEFDDRIQYDERGVLLTDVHKAAEMIEHSATYEKVIYPQKMLQHNYLTAVTYATEQLVDQDGEPVGPGILETVPKLLKFEMKNELEKVTNLKKKLKQQKAGS